MRQPLHHQPQHQDDCNQGQTIQYRQLRITQFDFKTIPGYSVLFDLNDKKELTALTFMQPNGNFKAKIK